MKRKRFFPGLLGFALLCGFVFAGCDSPFSTHGGEHGQPDPDVKTEPVPYDFGGDAGGPAGTAAENNMPVYRRVYQSSTGIHTVRFYTGSGTIKVACAHGKGDDPENYPAVGTIDKGILTLDLPASIDNACLRPVSTGLAPTITVSPEDAKGAEGLALYNSAGTAGFIAYIKYSAFTPEGRPTRQDTIKYFYFDRDVSITGAGTIASSAPGATATFQVAGKKGWNRIYVCAAAHEGWPEYTETYTTDLEQAPAGLHWVLYED